MSKTISLRSLIKTASFVIGTIVVLASTALCGYNLASKYRTNLEYTYVRALNELSTYVSNMEAALTKGLYANTNSQLYSLSAKLISESNSAKSSISQIPLSDVDLNNVNKFISQVGDFASYISKSVSSGREISKQDFENLKMLTDYAKVVNVDIKDVVEKMNSSKIYIGEPISLVKKLSVNTNKESQPNILTGFQSINDIFSDYPKLIYDGPFSDHLLNRESKFLNGQKEITLNQAKEIIAEFMDTPESGLNYSGDTKGNMPLYNFSFDNATISLTKMGGYIDYIFNSRNIEYEHFNVSDAEVLAKAFMAKHNIKDMKESYYVVSNGVCTINYAYEKDDIVYYSDLIKVGVALDNGEIVSFNSSGYLMNHTDRPVDTDIISIDTARKAISKNLVVDKEGLACIPTQAKDEVLCYEFKCTGFDNDKVIVYINAKTGQEEDILLLLMSDGGTLVI